MTVILTSAGFGTPQLQKEFLEVLPKPPSRLKLAYVTTASKVEEHKSYVERDRKVLTSLGFQIEAIDIEGQKIDSLRQIFANADIIYVQGGNTFYLLKQIRESGFSEVVNDLLNRGAIYVGVSAGSYVACPTIEMATWKHQDRQHFGLTDFTGLNLVPFLVSVHYNREKYREALQEGVQSTKLPVRILTDEQALIIRDGSVKLIGSGEEVKI